MKWFILLSFLSLSLAADDWVLHVPGGLDAVSEVAKLHQLDNLGEVIPGTDLYHFAQSSRRAKRSLQDLSDQFHKNPLVSSHKVQESLIRTKRVPIPQESARSTGNQLCFINTLPSDTKEARRCIFPFSYKGKTYIDCTADHSSNGAEWCATQVDSDGEVINKQWGDCDKKSLSCLTLGAGSLGSAPESRPEPRPEPRPESRPPPPRQPFRPPPQSQNRFPFPPPQFQQGRIPQQGGFQPQQQGRIPQQGGFPPGFRPQQGGFPPQQGGFPPQQGGFQPQQGGFQPQQPPARAFPQQPQRNQPNPQPKSALPPQFQFNPFLLDLANKLAGGSVGNGAELGSQVPEETFEELDRSTLRTNFNDEAWPHMWFLNRGGKGMDMNVEEAWAQGVTGKGVVVTILDDGVEKDHPDLEANYDPEASVDLNDNDKDPQPRYDIVNSNKHGTRCAGTVSASANNSDCAVGIAYDSKIGGVRILDGNIIDALEAKALSYNRDYIDIYSASWGPNDDGKTVDGPGPLAKMALQQGAEKGRQGKGSIFVWASGNGGKYLDNCNCDGYTTSIYTLSVSSASEFGRIPWYSEPCSSALTTTYSSGTAGSSGKERKVVTTDLHGRCTKKHTGTSASSPMAAGIVALALEANPDMTWRDVQHIIVRTSLPAGNLKADDWASNSVGLEFSHSFGFGLMDAGSMVKLAKVWNTVPEQVTCTTAPGQSGVNKNRPIVIKGETETSVELDATDNCGLINHLEHVHLLIDMTSGAARGDLSVSLTSPNGTKSILLGQRPFDDIRTGLNGFGAWPMMSVHFWGEPVAGPWTLTVANAGDKPCVLNDWQLIFYGTESDPQPGVPMRPDFETEILDDDAEIFDEADEEVFEVEIDTEKPEKLEILNDRSE